MNLIRQGRMATKKKGTMALIVCIAVHCNLSEARVCENIAHGMDNNQRKESSKLGNRSKTDAKFPHRVDHVDVSQQSN
jgi:hypothetical protein